MKKLDRWKHNTATDQHKEIAGKLAINFCVYASAPTLKNFDIVANLIEEVIKIQPFLEKPEYWNAKWIAGYKDQHGSYVLCQDNCFHHSNDVVMPDHDNDLGKMEAKVFDSKEKAEQTSALNIVPQEQRFVVSP